VDMRWFYGSDQCEVRHNFGVKFAKRCKNTTVRKTNKQFPIGSRLDQKEMNHSYPIHLKED
jgi:hypothetical protein